MGAPSPLNIKPGVVKVDADLAVQGRWVDANRVRFVNGRPQPIGGNIRYHATATPGVPRAILCWDDVTGNRYICVATTRKVWIYTSRTATPINITPARATGTLVNNPFTFSNGSAVVTVTSAAHGLLPGDAVFLSGATIAAGITIGGEYVVVATPTSGTYTIQHSANANANTTGGGAAVAYVYEISPGNVDTQTAQASAWGSGAWGVGPWGGAGSGASEARFWSLDLFGSLLTLSYNGGTLYQWTPGTSIRAITCTGAPVTMRGHFITESRFPVAFGTSDALTLQWASVNSLTDWVPTASNTANQRRLQVGTRIVNGTPVQGLGNLIWTDAAVYTLSFTGSAFVFDSAVSGRDCGLIGPKAFCVVNSIAYWMGPNGFHRWLGYVEDTPRQQEVYNWFQTDINYSQANKVVCRYDPTFNEITWHYPGANATEPTRYIAVCLEDYSWTVGTMARTAAGQFKTGDARPILTTYAGFLQLHEAGNDDDGAPMNAFIQSAATELKDGSIWYDVRGFIPDFKYHTGDLTVTLNSFDRADTTAVPLESESETISPGDEIVDFDINGRAISVRLESPVLNSFWRWGTPKLDLMGRGSRR